MSNVGGWSFNTRRLGCARIIVMVGVCTLQSCKFLLEVLQARDSETQTVTAIIESFFCKTKKKKRKKKCEMYI